MDYSVERIDGRSHSSSEVKSLLSSSTKPLVLTNMIDEWPASKWTLDAFTRLFGHLVTTFKLYRRNTDTTTPHPARSNTDTNTTIGGPAGKRRKCDGGNSVVMETDCSFVDASFDEFHRWMNGDTSKKEGAHCAGSKCESNVNAGNTSGENVGALGKYPVSDYWAYADYKYMAELFSDSTSALAAVDWSPFGYRDRNGFESTLWVSSNGANTPCHQDCYGTNMVAQLHGTKTWTLYPPQQTPHMQPSRIPYEESSVFSLVDPITNTAAETKLRVDLCAGEVLYVPKHWWHYVESATPSISVNTWLEHTTDPTDRLKESLVNILVYSFKSKQGERVEKWLNPTQALPESFDSCVELVRRALGENTGSKQHQQQQQQQNQQQLEKSGVGEEELEKIVDANFIINCFASSEVLDKVVDVMKTRLK